MARGRGGGGRDQSGRGDPLPGYPSYLSLASPRERATLLSDPADHHLFRRLPLRQPRPTWGPSGTLANQWQVEGEGWTDSYESDCYSMRWFGREEPLNTYYIYRNGFLDHIEICPEETGCTAQDMRRALESMYGSPTHEDGDSVGWADPFTANTSPCPPGRVSAWSR